MTMPVVIGKARNIAGGPAAQNLTRKRLCGRSAMSLVVHMEQPCLSSLRAALLSTMGPNSHQCGASTLRDPDENRMFCGLSLPAALLLVACGQESVAEREASTSILPKPDSAPSSCINTAHLTGDMTGAIETSFVYMDESLQCESMRRPENQGARLRFQGGDDPNRLSVIIAIPGLVRGEPGSELASNITVTVEGSGRFFSSADLDGCWTDVTSQELIEDARYAIAGEVYCIAPIVELNGTGAVTINSLTFESTVDWDAT